jgi:hypothetical protein
MAWACTLPSGTVVNIEDLSIETMIAITTDAGLPVTSWLNVAYAPLLNPQTAVAVLKACAVKAGEPEPSALTVGAVFRAFNQVVDDRPTEYEGDIPKAEDAPTTNGSSGVLVDSVGLPT